MDKKPKRMVPEVRFKGFTDDWEQHKLGEITIDMYNGQTPSRNNSEFWKGNIPWLTSGELNHDIITDTVEKITKLGQKDKHLRLIKKGTFVIAITGLEAPGTRGNCALLGIDTTINQSVMAIYPDHKKVTSDFLFDWYEKVGTEYGITYTQGTKQQSYNVNLLSILPIMITHNLKEQYKISQLLKITNRLISLQQRKLEQLKQLKTAMLQQLLVSKKDGLIPNIRFKDFTETWEQRKLGDVATFSKGSGYSKSDLKSSGTPVILYGRLYTNYELVINSINTFTSAKNNSVYSKGGEVIVPASGETAKDISIASVVNKPNFLLGGDLNIIHPNKNIKSIFLAVSISNGETKKDMARRAQGKSIVHLHNTDLSQIKLAYPSEAEQEKIDSYFLKFDSLIALHQCKLNQLSKMKKFCLQKMFI